jgi:flagellar biosynthesis protein FlhA
MTAIALPFELLPDRTRKLAELALAFGVVFIIALLVVPLPPALLDLFLAASIGASLVVLLTALNTVDPLDFSTFPSVLLLLTLFRLALNVSSTRLILGRGEAGRVIQAFGEFVIGGNYAVGLVIFLILIAINFVVITKGAGRVAEVAARFTLDAMPGKQMAIDADLSAGLIDEREARRRREEIARHADFYGAMDGASKFVKGDAIAALLITGINIIGGIFVGIVQRGLPITRALSTYTILSVGDGLVTQIPALIISTAAGLMVTHAADGTRMSATLARQLGLHPRALWITAASFGIFALVPGLPALPFLVLAGGTVLVARMATARAVARVAAATAEQSGTPTAAKPAAEEPLSGAIQLDTLELDVGYGLIPLVDERQGGELLNRVSLLRKQTALELGVLMPSMRIRDDLRLPANEYVLRIRGVETTRAEVLPRFLLALDTGNVVRTIDGIDAVDPSFGMPGRWIAPGRRVEAEADGYMVVEPAAVITTHLHEVLKTHAAELLGRQDVQEMLDTLRKSHPALVEDIIPAKLSLGTLHRVLQRLLRERVPIRDLVTILEALGDLAEQTKDVEMLTEHVRRALGPVIARQYMDGGAVRGITIGPRLESALLALFSPRPATGGAGQALLNPASIAHLLRDLNTLATTHAQEGHLPPLITPPGLRVGVRRIVEPVMAGLPVLSLAELPAHVTVSAVGTWEMAQPRENAAPRSEAA